MGKLVEAETRYTFDEKGSRGRDPARHKKDEDRQNSDEICQEVVIDITEQKPLPLGPGLACELVDQQGLESGG